MMKKAISKVLMCALSSLFLGVASVEAANAPVCFNPMLPNYPEEYYWYHNLSWIHFNDAVVEIQDGSHWKVAYEDRAQLMSWRLQDAIVITRNHRSASEYAYYLTNQSNGSYVRVNLIKGPTVNGAYTLLIEGMNVNSPQSRSINLTNTTCWAIDPDDSYKIGNWQVNDPVIIGRNDSWFASYPSLLIDVSTNIWVRAKKI